MEKHHTIPVSELKEGATTKVEDIVMVCSNCHRVLHRNRPWINTEKLKCMLKNKQVFLINNFKVQK
ncbi:HNH endonuclease [Bacillus toyonensis]|nr:HNH endonuclease [Bacillus toyonensis]